MGCSRRDFFGELTRTMLDGVADSIRAVGRVGEAAASTDDPPQRRWLRPPGAIVEERFLGACTRCTDCVNACPHAAIRRLGPEFGPVAGTPVVIPEEAPCYLCEDMPCIAACPTGALLATPAGLVEMGTAVVDAAACYRTQGQPCDYCVVRCPLKPEAIAFVTDGAPRVHESHCAGCGVCAYLCPAKSIFIQPRGAGRN
ncbi:MAG: 4Fe-4S dicluster domain-containing protein [Planctomycetota bacterium]